MTGSGSREPAPQPQDDSSDDPAAAEPAASLPPPAEGPPGGGIFSLEGRRAPGLYLVAWILSAAGLGLMLLIGPMASDEAPRFLLVVAGAVILTLGLSAAAGSQILDRRDRHPDRYRGPAPLLIFAIYFFTLALVGIVSSSSGLADPDSPPGFLAVGLLQVLGYVIAVWLFVVLSGALSWSQMGWPTWARPGLASALRATGVAIATVLPATFGILVVTGILAMLLDVQAPDILPTARGPIGALAIAGTAAVIVPVGEELFFRGFALTAWLRDLGARNAIIRSAVFFALIHIVNISTDQFTEGLGQAILQTVAILPLGLLLGWLFVRHGMTAAIAGHVTYNASLLFLLLLSTSLPQPV